MLGFKKNTAEVIEFEGADVENTAPKPEKDAFALRQMLDSMPTNVMTCDVETLEIDYINTTSVETLRRIEEHLPAKPMRSSVSASTYSTRIRNISAKFWAIRQTCHGGPTSRSAPRFSICRLTPSTTVTANTSRSVWSGKS